VGVGWRTHHFGARNPARGRRIVNHSIVVALALAFASPRQFRCGPRMGGQQKSRGFPRLFCYCM